MRQFYNNILAFLVTASLTDDEFATCTAEIIGYNQQTYDDIARVLKARESVSDILERLAALYKAKGFTVTEISTAKSNIFIGSPL